VNQFPNNGLLDYCVVNFHQRIESSDFFYNFSLGCIVGCFLILSIDEKENAPSPRRFSKVIFTIGWYYTTLIVVVLSKYLLKDNTCNVHANSVSGHFNMVTFGILGLIDLYFFLGVNPRFSKGFFVFFGLYCISSFAMLYETYFNGYHSLRQVIYGSAMGIASFFLFTNVMLSIEQNNRVLVHFILWMTVSMNLYIFLSYQRIFLVILPSLIVQGVFYIVYRLRLRQ
jgi:hypothetical protein